MAKAEDALLGEEEKEEGEDLCDCEFSLAYGAKILLNNAKLHLKRGKLYGLCGPNGAGKVSAALKALCMHEVKLEIGVQAHRNSSVAVLLLLLQQLAGNHRPSVCCCPLHSDLSGARSPRSCARLPTARWTASRPQRCCAQCTWSTTLTPARARPPWLSSWSTTRPCRVRACCTDQQEVKPAQALHHVYMEHNSDDSESETFVDKCSCAHSPVLQADSLRCLLPPLLLQPTAGVQLLGHEACICRHLSSSR